MILPSIDIMNGQAVQLIGGRRKVLDAGDPREVARRFRVAGCIAVVDLDAALGQGDNRALIRELVRMAPCRVGGGIRDAATALDWLDHGAESVVLGTAARPDVLEQLPPERTIAALDADSGEVVTHGWRKRTGETVETRMQELRPLVGGFLVTLVEREGRLQGIDLERARQLRAAAGGNVSLTLAGGVTEAREVAELDAMGADAQVGMALYTGRLSLADGITTCLQSDRPDGLWPTVITDVHGVTLGLAWSSAASVAEAVSRRRGIYHSRRRGLWTKGATSGATQELLRIDADCDRDALRFMVRQAGDGFCHRGTRTCWGEDYGLPRLARRLAHRLQDAPDGSYTARLLRDDRSLRAKLLEEARELSEAGTPEETAWEAADVIYFTMVAMVRGGASLADVEAELQRRALRVRRREEDDR